MNHLRPPWLYLILLLAFVATVGCAPPRTVDTRLGGLPGYYDANTDTVYIDSHTLAQWEAVIPGTAQWTRTHEEGHRATLHSTLDVDAEGKVRLERLAQCWAETQLGHGPPYTDDETGYWDCPDHLAVELRGMPDAT